MSTSHEGLVLAEMARHKPEYKQTKVKTVNEPKLKIFGSTGVEVALEDQGCGRHKFLIADVKTLQILGVHFFEALQMTIDFGKKVIQWERPSRHSNTKEEQSGIFRHAEWYS